MKTKVKLSKQTLLTVSQNISLYYPAKILASTQKLVILVIDPQHLHAYWNLGHGQLGSFKHRVSDGHLVLRIYSLMKKNQHKTQVKPIIEISIKDLQSKQKIRLPIGIAKPTFYRANIGKKKSNIEFIPLLSSNLIFVSPVNKNDQDSNSMGEANSFVENGIYPVDNVEGGLSKDDFSVKSSRSIGHYSGIGNK